MPGYISTRLHLRQWPRMTHVRIEGSQDRQHQVNDEQHQDGGNHRDKLDQHTGHYPAQRLKPERQQAKDTVHAPLQLVRNERKPVAELHDVVDRAIDKAESRDDSQNDWIWGDGIERPQESPNPDCTDNDRPKAESLLYRSAK